MQIRLIIILLLALSGVACQKKYELPPIKISDESATGSSVSSEQPQSLVPASLHKQILTLDAHINLPPSFGSGDASPLKPGHMQVDFPSMRRDGNLDAGFLVIYSEQGPLNAEGYEKARIDALAMLDAIDGVIARSQGDAVLVRSSDELVAAAKNKLAFGLGMENAYPIGRDFEHLQTFYDRGVRYMSLTHFENNHFADSAMAIWKADTAATQSNDGLSSTGLLLVKKLNNLGVLIDVSLMSSDALLATVRHSHTPVIASHSSSRIVHNHPRALGDSEIRAIAERGGLIHLVAFDVYLREMSKQEVDDAVAIKKALGLDAKNWYHTASQAQVDELRRQRNALDNKYPRATVSNYVDHIDHVVSIAGIDHVGIASEFGGGGGVKGWDYVSETPAITAELMKRGYSAGDIEKIWSGNFLRVWKAAETYAKQNKEISTKTQTTTQTKTHTKTHIH